MSTPRKLLQLLAGGAAAALLLLPTITSAQEPSHKIIFEAATGKLRPATIPVAISMRAPTGAATPNIRKVMPFISPGTLEAAEMVLRGRGVAGELGISLETLGCSKRNSADEHGVRVNQDCTFRRQAEEMIAFNPAEPDNLLAGQNDSRVGFNQCGIDWSTDNGTHWGDLLPPFRQKINNPPGELPTAKDPNRHTILGSPGTLHTYDAASDPDPAFDSQGRGFFSCVAFDVFSNASMLYVAESPLGAQGSYFFNIGTFSRSFIVVEDNDAAVFHDKPFIAADFHVGSPNRDHVYATWTVFKFSPKCGPQPNPDAEERFCEAPIFGSMSTDHGHTWSTPEQISGTSDALCFFGNFFQPSANPHSCNFDQGSDPIALASGDLEVIFNNGNTAANNPNAQQLGVHCHPTGNSKDGTAHLNCAAPSKVGDDISVGEPVCDFGRGPEECIPGAFIRTNDFPRIGLNRSNGHLYATWQDYRTGEFDIQLSRSTDGGHTWTELGTANPDRGLDHYFPAVGVVRGDDGADRVGDSYYRTQRVADENTGVVFAPCPQPAGTPCQAGVQREDSDYVLAGGTGAATPYHFKVVSPVFPPPDGIQAGFNGDYSGLIVKDAGDAHPIWSDTRNADPFAPANGVTHDEDVFTVKAGLPNGRAKVSAGHIGSD